jgi:hypothetical protein
MASADKDQITHENSLPLPAFHEWLGYAGLVPFIASALAYTLTGATFWFHLFSSYSLLIMSFMAGSWWGSEIRGGRPRRGWLLLSNVIALAGWLAYLLAMNHAADPVLSVSVFLGIQILAFGLLGWLDVTGKSGLKLVNYPVFRLRLTIIVIVCHALLLAA